MAKFDYEGAKKAGYSDEEIMQHVGSKYPNFDLKGASAAGYGPQEIVKFIAEKEMPSSIRSAPSAFLKGALRGVQGINPLQPKGPIHGKLQEDLLQKFLPSRPEHDILERAGGIAPYVATGGEGLLAKGAQLVGGTLSGELAKEMGLGSTGQAVSEAAGMGIPGLIKGGIKKGIDAIRKTVPEKMESGLTKLRVMEAKFPKAGTLSAERQSKVIKDLDKEASQLVKKSVEKHAPISKAIEEGFDFEGKFHKEFGELKSAAQKHNPEINITPVSKFLRENVQKYKGITNPSSDVQAIKKEVRAFANNPQTGLNNLMKIYRDNWKKVGQIYETSLVTGKRKEYVDFLSDMNRSISDSFKHTLPGDSQWLQKFQGLNRSFKMYRDVLSTTNKLKGFLNGSPTMAQIDKLAFDAQTQNKLAVTMGKEGAMEIAQIAKDLKAARTAIKSLPKKEMGKFDAAFPVAFLIPFIGKLVGSIAGVAKTIKGSRYLYGWFLSTPKRRKALNDSLKALAQNDLEAYKNSTLVLQQEMNSEE